jgi:hypothetical protein
MLSVKLRRGALYITSFALGRGGLFAAPILLANLLPAIDYGALETAQAAASLMANAAAFGTVGLIPLVVLGHTATTSLAAIAAHHLGLAALCGVFAALAALCGLGSVWSFVALLAAAVALQSLGSTHLKTQGRSEASVLLDAGLFGLMALAALGAHLLGIRSVMPWVVAAALAYATVLTGVYLRVLNRERSAGHALQWRAALGMGLPLMLGGIVSLLATTSGRLGMGILAGPLVAADYAVLSRAAALPIIAHQLILIARFRNLFTLPHADVERAAEQIVGLVAASALGFWLLAPWLGLFLGPAFVTAWSSNKLPGAWIAAQAVLWSAIALNDLVISRHQVMARILPISASFIVLALGMGWLVLRSLGADLAHFVYAHAAVMLVFYVVQSAAMAANGVRLWRVWRTTVGAYLFMIILTTTLTDMPRTL